MLEYANQKLKELNAKILSPRSTLSKNKLSPRANIIKTIEYSNMSFIDFKSRIDSQTDWIVQALPFIPLKRMIPELLNLCKIQISAKELKLFSKELKTFAQPEEKKYSLTDFRSIIFSWYSVCHSTDDLRSKLINSISEFEEIKDSKLPDHEKLSVDNLLVALKAKLKEIPNYSIRDDNFEDKCLAGLHQIFNYYSKQQFLLGKTPTFDTIKANVEMLTIGKFIKFCKDFKIIDESDKIQAKKSLKIVQNAFIQSAEFGRNMHEHHFINALDLLAKQFFDKEYDKIHNTSWHNISLDEKKRKFYEHLECYDSNIYNHKLKEAAPHFGVDPYNRIPDYDLSKKYKVRNDKSERDKASLEEWKQKKNIEKMIEGEAINKEKGRIDVQKKYMNNYKTGKKNGKKNKLKDVDKVNLDDDEEEEGLVE